MSLYDNRLYPPCRYIGYRKKVRNIFMKVRYIYQCPISPIPIDIASYNLLIILGITCGVSKVDSETLYSR